MGRLFFSATIAGPPLQAAISAAPSPALTQELDYLFDKAAKPSASTPSPVDAGRAEPRNDWKVRFSFGPTLTRYFNTDINIRNSRIKAVVKNAQIGERNSMESYEVWKPYLGSGGNPLQFIDEPSNTFLLSLENVSRQFAINLMVFHPKFLVVDGANLNQDVGLRGSIEGRPVNGPVNLSDIFQNYHVTKLHFNVQLQLEKLVLLAEGGYGSLRLAPGASVGAYFGYSDVDYLDSKGESHHYASPYGPIGAGISASTRLIYAFPQDLFSASLAYQLTHAALSYPMMDGTASQGLNNQTITFSLGVKIY